MKANTSASFCCKETNRTRCGNTLTKNARQESVIAADRNPGQGRKEGFEGYRGFATHGNGRGFGRAPIRITPDRTRPTRSATTTGSRQPHRGPAPDSIGGGGRGRGRGGRGKGGFVRCEPSSRWILRAIAREPFTMVADRHGTSSPVRRRKTRPPVGCGPRACERCAVRFDRNK